MRRKLSLFGMAIKCPMLAMPDQAFMAEARPQPLDRNAQYLGCDRGHGGQTGRRRRFPQDFGRPYVPSNGV